MRNPFKVAGPPGRKRNTGHVIGLLAAVFVVVVGCILLGSHPAFAKSAEDFLLLDELISRTDGYESHVRVYGKNCGSAIRSWLRSGKTGCLGNCDGQESAHGHRRDEYVVLLPSLGRGVEDFTEEYGSNLTTRLVQAGYQVVLIQPRGIGESTGVITPGTVTFRTLVDDIKQVLDTLEITQAHFVGHAFGNRVARSFATLYPDYVFDVVLLAAGGQVPLSAAKEQLLYAIFLTADDETRLGFIETAFFAPGGDASVWLYGWNTQAALAQAYASKVPDVSFFDAGQKPILLIQPADDFIAPPEEAGLVLAEQLGDQVTYVEIAHAGHALLPEQPNVVAAHIIAYFASSQSRDFERRLARLFWSYRK